MIYGSVLQSPKYRESAQSCSVDIIRPQIYWRATCRVRRPRRTAAAQAAWNFRNVYCRPLVGTACGCPLSAIAGTTILICLYIVDSLPSRPTIIKRYILPAFRHFFSVWEKKRLQRKGRLGVLPRDPANAAPQYLVRGSQSAARHIRTQTRRSLNECVLVRLATQAFPSPLLVGVSNTAARLLKVWL